MRLVNIDKSYDKLKVLENFSLNIQEKKITCLLGPSGCGKTTILNIIANLTDYNGKVEKKDENISYIFQNKRLLPNLTVEENLRYVLLSVEKDKLAQQKKIDNALNMVELSQWKKAYPSELSGGMSQRVALARAFIYPSNILLMDEPFKGLDILLKKRLINAFLKLWDNDKKTVVFVTHDIDEALLISDKTILLSDKAKILFQTDLPYCKEKRDLSNDEFLNIRKEIYKKLSKI